MHERLKKTGKPVIVVLAHGAPVPSPVYSQVDAVISAGYTGQGASKCSLMFLRGHSEINVHQEFTVDPL